MEYTILFGADRDYFTAREKLTTQVNIALNNGSILKGGISFAMVDQFQDGFPIFYLQQAVISNN